MAQIKNKLTPYVTNYNSNTTIKTESGMDTIRTFDLSMDILEILDDISDFGFINSDNTDDDSDDNNDDDISDDSEILDDIKNEIIIQTDNNIPHFLNDISHTTNNDNNETKTVENKENTNPTTDDIKDSNPTPILSLNDVDDATDIEAFLNSPTRHRVHATIVNLPNQIQSLLHEIRTIPLKNIDNNNHSDVQLVLESKTSNTNEDIVEAHGLTNKIKTQCDLNINDIADIVYKNVEKKNRKFKFHTYCNSFLGSSLIDVLLKERIIKDRKEGISIGNELLNFKIIHHILFKVEVYEDSKNTLYSFSIDDQRKKKTADEIFKFNDIKNVSPIISKKTNYIPQSVIQAMPSEVIAKLNSNRSSRILKKLIIKHRNTVESYNKTSNQVVKLPELKGWMWKQSAKGLKSWQKRYFVVKRTHMLWSKKEMNITNPLDVKERSKFQNSMTLLTIKEVRPINSKRKRKFDIVTSQKEYHFRAVNPDQRDHWVQGLRSHMKVLANSLGFIRQSFIFTKNDDN